MKLKQMKDGVTGLLLLFKMNRSRTLFTIFNGRKVSNHLNEAHIFVLRERCPRNYMTSISTIEKQI